MPERRAVSGSNPCSSRVESERAGSDGASMLDGRSTGFECPGDSRALLRVGDGNDCCRQYGNEQRVKFHGIALHVRASSARRRCS